MKRYLYIALILFSAILNCRAAYYGFRLSNLNGGIKYHYGNGYLTCSRAGDRGTGTCHETVGSK